MTPLSDRFALPALALLLLAAAPGLLRGGPGELEDCRDPAALARIAPPPEQPNVTWTPSVLHTFSPSETYGQPPGNAVQATYPEDRIGIREVDADGVTLPVHWGFDSSVTGSRVRAYFYVHSGEPVVHPALSGLALAPLQLFRGTLPVTTMVIDGFAVGEGRELLEEGARRWIRDAWRHYRTSCKP